MNKIKYFLGIVLIGSQLNVYSQNMSNALFTGKPDITIPITEVNAKNIEIPIYLTYDASGNKVEDISSNVGLGWSLSTGGTIRRYVRGIPDDYYGFDNNNRGLGWLNRFDEVVNWHTIFGSDPLWEVHVDMANLIHDYDPGQDTNEIDKVRTWSLFNIFKKYWLDTEPDVFVFNLPGLGGEFYFDEDGKIRNVDGVGLNFDYTLNSIKEIAQFSITDEKGVRYVFGSSDRKSISIKGNNGFHFLYGTMGIPMEFSELVTTYNETWRLTSIISPEGEVITYTYEIESYALQPDIPKYKTGNETSETSVYTELTISVNSNRIKQISSDKFEINFNKDSYQREDLPGTYPIDSISVYSKAPRQFSKGFKLDYGLFRSSTLLSNPENFRLKLKSVLEYSGSEAKPAYVFHYNEQDILPSRLSKQQDLWGYFNNNGANSLIPKIYVYSPPCIWQLGCTDVVNEHDPYRVLPIPGGDPLWTYIIEGADRTPDIRLINGKIETVMDAFILEQIDYPEGGNIQYEYEPHAYYYDGSTYRGGGLRVKKIIISDGDSDNSNDMVRMFTYPDATYGTSGRLVNMPIYAYMNYGPDDANAEHRIHDDYLANKNNYFQKYVRATSANNAFYLGYPIVYQYVEVTEPGNGKTKYTYDANSLFGDYTSDFKTSINHNLIERPTETIVSVLACGEGDKGCNFYISPTREIGKDNYPFPSNENCRWKQGQILKVEKFDAFGNPVSEITNSYHNYFKSSGQPKYIYGLKYTTTYHPVDDQECGTYLDLCIFPKTYCGVCEMGNPQYIYGRYKIATDVAKKLSLTVEKVFDPLDRTKYITITKNFTYTNYGQIATVDMVNSNGTNLKTTYKYAPDYLWRSNPWVGDTQTGILYSMNAKNMISTPIEITQVKNDNVISSTLNFFKATSDNIIVPDITYSLDLINPILLPSTGLSDINLNSTNGAVYFRMSSLYDPKVYYDAYDSKGNLLQYHEANNIYTSYIWGYNKTYSVAKIENATLQEVQTALGGSIPELGSDGLNVSQNNSLRSGFSKAQVTTYTHSPLIGMTSQTDPNGLTTYYEYDSFGRLKLIKDMDGKILKTYNYHYKN